MPKDNVRVDWRLEEMRERAVSTVASKVKDTLAAQWPILSASGWSDSDISLILEEAIKQCSTEG